jgi:hypothetical protein
MERFYPHKKDFASNSVSNADQDRFLKRSPMFVTMLRGSQTAVENYLARPSTTRLVVVPPTLIPFNVPASMMNSLSPNLALLG